MPKTLVLPLLDLNFIHLRTVQMFVEKIKDGEAKEYLV